MDQFSVTNLGLQIGSRVVQGQVVAIVGKTGWTDRDHLHFIVFRHDDDPDKPIPNAHFKSLKVKFLTY
ncbi:MAG: hypothetical protein AAB710_02535 [Patescibacteria group bacterium]